MEPELVGVLTSFRIIGDDFDPDLFTSALNLAPSCQWRKGDTRPPLSACCSSQHGNIVGACWTLSTGAHLSWDAGLQLAQVVGLLQGKEDVLRQSGRDASVHYRLEIEVRIPEGASPGFVIDKRALAFARAIDAEILVRVRVDEGFEVRALE